MAEDSIPAEDSTPDEDYMSMSFEFTPDDFDPDYTSSLNGTSQDDDDEQMVQGQQRCCFCYCSGRIRDCVCSSCKALLAPYFVAKDPSSAATDTKEAANAEVPESSSNHVALRYML